MEKYRNRIGMLFVLPFIVQIAVFAIYPVGFALYLMFHNWDMITAPEFVGLRNFRFLLHDPDFWRALRNTVVFLLIHIPLQIIIALALATILALPIRARTFFRASFFLPVVISGAVITILWQKLLSTDTGLINSLLHNFGIPYIPWLTSPWLAMPSIAIMATWKNVGFYVVLFLAGILSVPAQLHEAARLEGATTFQEFRYVTLPLLKPSILLVVVLSTLGAFNLFIEPYVMTGGGPMGSTLSVVLYIYKQAFNFQHLGYATTIGFALALIILLVVLVQKKILEKGNDP